jgi:hypothetical protein
LGKAALPSCLSYFLLRRILSEATAMLTAQHLLKYEINLYIMLVGIGGGATARNHHSEISFSGL